MAESAFEVRSIPVQVFYSPPEFSEAFKSEVLSRFLNDEVGQLCRRDPIISMIGFRLYTKLKAKKDKKSEVRKSVMGDMRRLGSLFVKYKEVSQRNSTRPGSHNQVQNTSFVDIFARQNFPLLEQAVMEYTSKSNDSGMKSGLKINSYFLVLKAAKILKAYYLTVPDDHKAVEIDYFMEVLKLNYNMVFGDALYEINRIRQTRLRRVEQLPIQSELEQLREYTLKRMKVLLNDSYLHWTSSEYSELRNLVVSRLTLFNARRGGEPARLQIQDWKDCCDDVWIDPARVDTLSDIEKTLFQKTKLMYQTGKGNHIVPVLVPNDTIDAVYKLSNLEVRNASSILSSNQYLFPSTHLSAEHVSGWHAIHKVCIDANVNPARITATKMRHRISTLYAVLDVPPEHRNFMYKHLGHSSGVNEAIYQAPIAETEVLRVGQILHQFGMFISN